MTHPMIEVMARGLYERDGGPKFDEAIADARVWYRSQAAAILQALSQAGYAVVLVEPPKEMWESIMYPVCYDHNFAGCDPPPRLAWQRMLAAHRSKQGEAS